jgi:uncharacterized membrane protein
MKNRKFFAGLEEVLARILGLCVTLVFFAVYVSAKTTINTDWYGIIGYLSLFWLIYEVLSYILFIAFAYFSRDNMEMKSPESIAEIAKDDMNDTM